MALRTKNGWNIKKAAAFGLGLDAILLAVHFMGARDQWSTLSTYWRSTPRLIANDLALFLAVPALIVAIAIIQNLIAALLPAPSGFTYVRRRP